jgi:hypothetical protein
MVFDKGMLLVVVVVVVVDDYWYVGICLGARALNLLDVSIIVDIDVNTGTFSAVRIALAIPIKRLMVVPRQRRCWSSAPSINHAQRCMKTDSQPDQTRRHNQPTSVLRRTSSSSNTRTRTRTNTNTRTTRANTNTSVSTGSMFTWTSPSPSTGTKRTTTTTMHHICITLCIRALVLVSDSKLDVCACNSVRADQLLTCTRAFVVRVRRQHCPCHSDNLSVNQQGR